MIFFHIKLIFMIYFYCKKYSTTRSNSNIIFLIYKNVYYDCISNIHI